MKYSLYQNQYQYAISMCISPTVKQNKKQHLKFNNDTGCGYLGIETMMQR